MAGVTFEDVSKIYPDGTRAVSGLQLDIPDAKPRPVANRRHTDYANSIDPSAV